MEIYQTKLVLGLLPIYKNESSCSLAWLYFMTTLPVLEDF